ncbi:MAG: hypothetical protein ACLFR0_08360 [Alphaproteobacteria bacterium]
MIFLRPLLLIFGFALVLFLPVAAPQAQEEAYNPDNAICGVDNRGCVLKNLRRYAKEIERDSWRDQTFRELAKSFAGDGYIDTAISIIGDINTPDTKAMTIRGIGMEMAALGFSKDRLDQEFAKLRAEAEKIEHPPSYAIALTYIAMAQAFAGDNEGAWETAASMENDALRHKAYAETAEIQAEKSDFEAAMKSIAFIDSEAFRNKALSLTSKIFADQQLFDESYKAALQISNAYKKAQAIQHMLDTQKNALKEGQQEGTAP